MMRRTPMKRAIWPTRTPAVVLEPKAADPTVKRSSTAIRTRAVLTRVTAAPAAAIPKDAPVRSESYRRAVAGLPCKVCGIVGYSQAAHPNTGKGAGIKTDDRLCFPLCCDRPGVQGCHPKFDQHAMYTKAARRAMEPAWAADTRRRIESMGQWPANLPKLEDADAKH